MYANILSSIFTPYIKSFEKDIKNHIITEAKSIVVPALFTNDKVFSVTSLKTYFIFGNL